MTDLNAKLCPENTLLGHWWEVCRFLPAIILGVVFWLPAGVNATRGNSVTMKKYHKRGVPYNVTKGIRQLPYGRKLPHIASRKSLQIVSTSAVLWGTLTVSFHDDKRLNSELYDMRSEAASLMNDMTRYVTCKHGYGLLLETKTKLSLPSTCSNELKPRASTVFLRSFPVVFLRSLQSYYFHWSWEF